MIISCQPSTVGGNGYTRIIVGKENERKKKCKVQHRCSRILPYSSLFQRTAQRLAYRHQQVSDDDNNSIHPTLALFDRSEIVLGKLLGRGAFCQVHELQDVRFNNSNNKIRPYFARPWWDETFQQAEKTRQSIRISCQDEAGNARYVIKHLRPNLEVDRSYKVFVHAAADLVMEYDILSRLSHPNIVQLRGGAVLEKSPGVSIDKEDYFLVLERVEQTLSQQILSWKRSELPSPPACRRWSVSDEEQPSLHLYYIEKLQFAREIASAIAYIHQHNLIFRDLKPDNVGIVNGKVKLFDFGLCRELPKIDPEDNNEQEPIFRMSGVGTRRYMAPETICGHGYNQKIDCYSWAMVCYEMLSLQKPYASYNREVHRILVCQNEERPSLSLNVPQTVKDLLQKAWAQDYCKRPTMTEIHEELGPLIESAERQALTPVERSLNVIMEMAELLTVEDHSSGHDAIRLKKDDSFISRKSIADLTASTASSVSTEGALPFFNSFGFF